MGRVYAWTAKHPVGAIMLVALLAVVINCYPVVFCGKSFVSPSCMDALVYDWWPPLPGMKPGRHVSQHGSDTAAMMLWGVPAGIAESRSVLEHGELPLWNRYGHCGDAFIGQNVTMMGDPLQLIIILGRGSAGAWDVKFVVAKFLFCVGFGLLVLRLLGNLPLSLLFTALAAYCGAFFFIKNHPVFFVFCYAPWVLLSALAWLDLRTGWPVRWGIVWLLANFACFNAGHVEVAVDLIGGLNLAALVYALTQQGHAAGWARVIGRMGVGTILFLGLTAPMWLSFLAALNGAYSLHSEIQVTQLAISSLPGVFDDLFYLLLRADATDSAPAPGTSLLVLTGCILAVLKWRQLKGEPFFWVNSGAILLWGGCVFGWIPASVLATVPLINRVNHVCTDFSFLLVIHLVIQSAYGFKSLAGKKNFRRATIDFFWVGLIFGGIMLAFGFGNPHRSVPWNYFLCAAAGALGAPLLFLFLKSRPRPITAAGWAGILVLGFIPQLRFGLYNFGNEDLLMLPGPRVALNTPSQAVAGMQAENSAPFRVVGLHSIFFGDYAAVYGLEDIRSCAPLSNGKYVDLVRGFPGMTLLQGWMIDVTDLVSAQPLLNLLNVKYLLVRPTAQIEIEDGVGFRVSARSDFLVLENLKVWPRAFFTDKVVTNASTEAFIQQVRENRQQPVVSLAQDEINRQPGLSALLNTRTATVMSATNYLLLPNSTGFDIHAPAAGVVCLTEGQAKDFTATANGEPKTVLTMNCAFKGIYLDQPGDYHIQFTYRPRYWRLACISFWGSASMVVALVLVGEIRARRRLKAAPTSDQPHE